MYKGIEHKPLSLRLIEEIKEIEQENISEIKVSSPSSVSLDSNILVENLTSTSELKVVWIGDSQLDDASKKTVDGMAKYLNLNHQNYRYIPIVDEVNEEEFSEQDITDGFGLLVDKLIDLQPLIMIVLGAKLTNYMLEKREKLTKVHGQIFTKNLKNSQNEVVIRWMPCFHPELIQINRKIKESVILDLDSLKSTIL